MTSILLIGYGNMGSALLVRWKDIPEFSPIMVVDPNAPENIPHVKQISDVPEHFRPGIVVLAVKPQQLDDVLPQLAKKFGTVPTYLSIAAGKTLSYYEGYLGQGASVVRAMPNTPAMIGQGMTALVGNKALTVDGQRSAIKLMKAVGEILWLENEDMMDAVTAISGSGPAYYYYIIECMIEAGVKNGLSKEDATYLAVNTCLGSAKLVFDSNLSLTELRRNVTSPGGTTAAALAVFQKDNALQKLIEGAVDAAVRRAKEL